ncbi:MAG: HAMP domain-containing sensor histidine kinase [Pseudomonadota bacterium]
MGKLGLIFRATAVRLTVLYTVLFGMLAFGVVLYVGWNTGNLLLAQFRTTIDEEVGELSAGFRRGGLRRLIQLVDARSRAPGANLYLISDASSRIVAGNVFDLDRDILMTEGWTRPPFRYVRFDGRTEVPSIAFARVFSLPGGLRLLVGRDMGESQRFRSIIQRALTVSFIVLLVTAILLWFLVGRRALKYLDQVSHSSDQIISGDLSQRLPLSGSGDEFDRLAGRLNSLIARVEQLDRGVRLMSDSIAHDLKTPLTRLRSHAETALNRANPKEQAQALETVVGDADKLIKTFDALLMISKVEAGARAAELEPVDLTCVVRDIYELFEPSAEAENIKLSLDLGKQLTVVGNRELLAQALTNLLDNAIKYGSDAETPMIKVALKDRDGKAVLSVSDNGAGIPEEDRDRVTERFVRLDPSRTKSGSGLGLGLVRAIAHMHHGSLLLDDNAPGLVVSLQLPMQEVA